MVIETFGERLARLRKAKGLTQKELADLVGFSQRMMAHYEKHVKRPTPEKLGPIAKALGVTLEELLGIASVKRQPGAPKNAYLRRKLQQVENFAEEDQKAVLTVIDALTNKNKGKKN